jgi:hypothetical protein
MRHTVVAWRIESGGVPGHGFAPVTDPRSSVLRSPIPLSLVFTPKFQLPSPEPHFVFRRFFVQGATLLAETAKDKPELIYTRELRI